MTQFSTVVVDFPWRYKSPGWKGGADRHYETLPSFEFYRLPIQKIAAQDAHLWIWAPDTFLHDVFTALMLWNFTRRATFPWIKLSSKEISAAQAEKDIAYGKEIVGVRGRQYRLAYGNGYYGRANPEYLILATRGKNIVQQDGRHARKLIHAPVDDEDGAIVGEAFYASQEAHSTKPEPAYEIIRNMSPGPRLDVFARSERDGFYVWGREVVCTVSTPELDEWSRQCTQAYQMGAEHDA